MRIKRFPLSPSLAGQLRTVTFLPSDDSSITSPVDIFSCSAMSGSMRAIFLPTSRCSATSTTFKVVVLAACLVLLLFPLILLMPLGVLSLVLLFPMSEDIAYYPGSHLDSIGLKGWL